MGKKLSKAKQREKEFYRKIAEQKRIIAYKEKYGTSPKSLSSLEVDLKNEKILNAKEMKGVAKNTISGSVAKLGNSVKRNVRNKGKLSKKAKKRLKKKENFYNSKEWRALRYEAFKIHGRQCLCCGAKPPQVVLHVDHIKPRSVRPDLELDINNLQILCEDCNLGKSNKDSIDYRINKPEVEEKLDRQLLKSSPI